MKLANKQNIKSLTTADKTKTVERNKTRIRNREMLRESRAIAIKIHDRLEELGWTKKRLSDEMNVLPQQVTKYLSGKENMTLQTLVGLQKTLNIALLTTYEFNNKVELS